MAPISKAKKQMAYARSCRGKNEGQKVEIKKAYLRACKRNIKVEKVPAQRENESELRDALVRNLEAFLEAEAVSVEGGAQDEGEEDAPWVEDTEPEVSGGSGLEEGRVGQDRAEKVEVGVETTRKMMQLKGWDPKTDGGHLPGLRGKAAGGNSKRTEQRRRKSLASDGDEKLM